MTRVLFFGAAITLGAWLQSASSPDSVRVVEAWFDAVNALDGTEESVERLVSLYHPDAQHITGPEPHQIGTVTFDGAESIRFMARRLAETRERIVYRVDVATAREVSRKLFHLAEGPWGGDSVAVQFHAAYTRREDGVRFTVPGAAFFRIENGKIGRVRLYLPDGESAEVEPLG